VQPSILFPLLKGIEVVIDAQSNGDMPDWWQSYNAGTCRATNFGASGMIAPVSLPCLVLWTAAPNGGINAFQTADYPPGTPFPDPAPNRLRIKVAMGTALGRTTLLNTTKQYHAFTMSMNTGKSIDDPLNDPPVVACVGCDVPVSLVLNQIGLYADAIQDYVTAPLANRCITWQGGSNTPLEGCTATPARNTTWGNVKSLYR
jgi:hypothetical protein